MESASIWAPQGLAKGVEGGTHGGQTSLWLPAVPFSGPVCSCQLLNELQPEECWMPLAVGTGDGRS